MLQYYPERRATAQDMLNHPWLNMEPNLEFKLTDRDYEKMIMVKKGKGEKKDRENVGEKDVQDSDVENNMADDEDNDDIEVTEEFDGEESYIQEPEDTIHIQNFNNSFAVYGQHVKLSALDKANPQFRGK
jgi:hypothetical protein